MAVVFDKTKEFDIDVKIKVNPINKTTTILGLTYEQDGSVGKGIPDINNPGGKELVVTESTSQSELKSNISENLKTIFGDTDAGKENINKLRQTFSEVYTDPQSLQQKVFSAYTGKPMGIRTLKDNAIAALDKAIKEINLKNTAGLPKAGSDAEPKEKFSEAHLKLLTDLKTYIETEGKLNGGVLDVFKIDGINKPLTTGFNFKYSTSEGANNQLYRLAENLKHMTMWNDNNNWTKVDGADPNVTKTFYPGWTKNKDKTGTIPSGSMDKMNPFSKAGKPWYFESVKDFLSEIVNATTYPAAESASVLTRLAVKNTRDNRGGRATRRYKKMRGSRSRNYYNKSRKYY